MPLDECFPLTGPMGKTPETPKTHDFFDFEGQLTPAGVEARAHAARVRDGTMLTSPRDPKRSGGCTPPKQNGFYDAY